MSTHIECLVKVSAVITLCFDSDERIPQLSGDEFKSIVAENFMDLPHLNNLEDTSAIIDEIEVINVQHEVNE